MDNGRLQSTVEAAMIGTETKGRIWFNEYFDQKWAVTMLGLNRFEEPRMANAETSQTPSN